MEAFLNKVTRPQACPRRHVVGLVKGMIDLMSEIDKESLLALADKNGLAFSSTSMLEDSHTCK